METRHQKHSERMAPSPLPRWTLPLLPLLLLLLLALCLPGAGLVGAASSSSSSCDQRLSCFACTPMQTDGMTDCGWCSTPADSSSFGRCMALDDDAHGGACGAPASLHLNRSDCAVQVDCAAAASSCRDCVAAPLGAVCGWIASGSSHGVCLPLSKTERSGGDSPSSVCPFWVAGATHHGANFGWSLLAALAPLLCFWALYRPGGGWSSPALSLSLPSRDSLLLRLRGAPCSPAMVAEFFSWGLDQSDGIGAGGNDVVSYPTTLRALWRATTQNANQHSVASTAAATSSSGPASKKAKKKRRQRRADENGSDVHVSIVEVSPASDDAPPAPAGPASSSSSWSHLFRGAGSQWSMWSSVAALFLLCLLQFADRWFLTPRAGGPHSEMRGAIQWGSLAFWYDSTRSTYACSSSSSLLSFLPTGQCLLISATGVLLYLCGVAYLFLLFARIYTEMYAHLRNVNLVARRDALLDGEASDAGGEAAARDNGGRSRCWCHCRCHAFLVHNFVRLRYARFYFLCTCMLPLCLFRYLAVRDALAPVQSATIPHVSAVLLLLCALLELAMLVYEERTLLVILERHDRRAEEEYRRRGAHPADDAARSHELHAIEAGYSASSSRRSGRPAVARSAHFPDSSASLLAAHLAESAAAHADGAALDYEDMDDERAHAQAEVQWRMRSDAPLDGQPSDDEEEEEKEEEKSSSSPSVSSPERPRTAASEHAIGAPNSALPSPISVPFSSYVVPTSPFVLPGPVPVAAPLPTPAGRLLAAPAPVPGAAPSAPSIS